MANVLVVGSGAREAAIGLKFLQSPQVEHVYVAPGNDGMTTLGLDIVPIDVMAFDALTAFARDNKVDLTFVGPEQPLVGGIVDAFEAADQRVFGVNQALAQLEGSKTFAKHFMQQADLPTARAKHVASLAEALAVLADWGTPIVIKADGLAAGKGVVVALKPAEAETALHQLYAKHADAPALMESYLTGEEASVMAFFAGDRSVILPLSQDHKRRFNGDSGPNTGGMGAISPAAQFTSKQQAAAQDLMRRTIAAFSPAGLSGHGVVYMGLMFTPDGPKILEYNMRLGDPETQVLLPQIKGDFYALITALLTGETPALQLDGLTYVGVVLSHPAYPAASQPALPIVPPVAALLATHGWIPAAVSRATDGTLRTAGGRVLTLLAAGDDAQAAQQNAYALVQQFAGELAYRDDIGAKTIARQP